MPQPQIQPAAADERRVDEVAVTAFLLSGLKAVHPFLSGGG